MAFSGNYKCILFAVISLIFFTTRAVGAANSEVDVRCTEDFCAARDCGSSGDGDTDCKNGEKFPDTSTPCNCCPEQCITYKGKSAISSEVNVVTGRSFKQVSVFVVLIVVT